jgi:ABC-2 type transport system ATP-binding protein
LIRADGLTRRFGDRTAVEDLSFDMPAGQLFALLGPNGAGKTTTVRLLLGLIAPTAGSATVAGQSLAHKDKAQLRARCGLLTEAPGFYDRLSAWDNLAFFGALYGLPKPTVRERAERHLREFGLYERRGDLFGTFSKGMKQKLAIVRAIFHDPEVLFMDEPTAGLDPEAARDIRELILSLKQQGRTILLCTHNLNEAERLADTVGILRQRLLVCAPLAELRRSNHGETQVHVEVQEADEATANLLRAIEGIRAVSLSAGSYQARVTDAYQTVPRLVDVLVKRGARILRVEPNSESLESIYLRHIASTGG